MSGSNAQLIKDHFAAKARFDRATILNQLTSDAKWWVPISGAQRGIATRPIEGGDTIADILTSTLSTQLYAKERTWTIEYVVADDTVGAAQVKLSTALAESGTPYENTYAYIFRFVDGKIAEIWEHLDTAYAFGLFDSAKTN
ncbi:nuclear transport factor 2 family protein [Streptomyces sp. NPDC056975]|uniref:nuclear transport factor 2 family protein n=1 Tax=Streptomyces sp. NPDC056975 TaxID=3345985 RepID=UPI0036291CEA